MFLKLQTNAITIVVVLIIKSLVVVITITVVDLLLKYFLEDGVVFWFGPLDL